MDVLGVTSGGGRELDLVRGVEGAVSGPSEEGTMADVCISSGEGSVCKTAR